MEREEADLAHLQAKWSMLRVGMLPTVVSGEGERTMKIRTKKIERLRQERETAEKKGRRFCGRDELALILFAFQRRGRARGGKGHRTCGQ